eukprot:TRINITY_DN4750_c0_g1_i5.p4 TRINITY_DN4750_c0_g1~~TRINITY_DN4750_c0_g1_i5.p4  ORF type:complete len:104 (-),score=23.21 TRINITY_DN4750_c0_g1_i5:176-487(-)
MDEEVAHAPGVVDAAFELTAGVAVRDTADDSPLAPIGRWRWAARKGMVVGGGRRQGWGKLVIVVGRDDVAVVGDPGDGPAHCASYRCGAGWELERGTAVGAVD